MRSSDGEGRSIRSDALYPALSGEWEVPVIRNAKITPVNEGGGGRVGGPPLRDHLWQGPPLPVTLRLIASYTWKPSSRSTSAIINRSRTSSSTKRTFTGFGGTSVCGVTLITRVDPKRTVTPLVTPLFRRLSTILGPASPRPERRAQAHRRAVALLTPSATL